MTASSAEKLNGDPTGGHAEGNPRLFETLWTGPVAVVVSDDGSGLIHEANDAFCRLIGYARDELIGRTTTELGIWVDPAARNSAVAPQTENEWIQPFEFQLRRKTGEIRTVLGTAARVTLNGIQVIASQLSDITERCQSEDRLRLLQSIARLGNEATSVDQVLTGTLQAVHHLFPETRASYGAIEGEHVRFVASCGPPDMASLSGLQFPLATAPEYAASLMRGEPIIVHHGATDPRIAPLEASVFTAPPTAMLDVPVCRNDQTVGVVCLDAPAPREWSEHERATMREVAALLAICLMHAHAEKELRTERELFQTMMDHVPDFVYIKDVESRFTRVNRAIAAFHGLDPEQYIGLTDFDLFPETLASQYYADERRVVATGQPILNRLEAQDESETVWALTSTVPVKDASDRVIGLVGVARDVSERQTMEDALRTSEERQRALLEAIPDMVFRFDRDGVFLDMRVNAHSPFWIAPEERLGRRLIDILPDEIAQLVLAAISSALETGEVATVEYTIERDGANLTFEMRIASAGDGEVVAIARDVSERKRLEQRLAYQASHDPLTGLPNRALFSDRLELALETARVDSVPVAVLFVDLDDFKSVNDEHGHAIGDRLLCTVGDRLRRAVRDGDTVARIGGDEFAIILDGLAPGSFVDAIAERISARLRQPVRIGSLVVSITASTGLAVGIPATGDGHVLLESADRAMYAAKRAGKNRFAVITLNGNTDNAIPVIGPLSTAGENGAAPAVTPGPISFDAVRDVPSRRRSSERRHDIA